MFADEAVQAFQDAKQAFQDANDPEFWEQFDNASMAIPASDAIIKGGSHESAEQIRHSTGVDVAYQALMEREALIGMGVIGHD